MQTAYLCTCCGDEGCGAVMFDVINEGAFVKWTHFVLSCGYPSDEEPDEIINAAPLFFEISNYHQAIGKLKSMLK